jgi:hypothetical protein
MAKKKLNSLFIILFILFEIREDREMYFF